MGWCRSGKDISNGGVVGTLAMLQIAPDLTSATGTIDRVCEAIDRAAAQGVELAVFPETFIPYYPYFSFVAPAVLMGKDHLRLYEWAVEVPSEITERLSKSATQHEMVLVVGVNERDGGSLYNTQLIFDTDGSLLLKRRKITPTYHERMVWGQGDGAGIRAVDTAVGKVGALACWEHYDPLARFALMEEREEIHCAQFPGSMVGQIFADQIEVTIRHHALESGCPPEQSGWGDTEGSSPSMNWASRSDGCGAGYEVAGRLCPAGLAIELPARSAHRWLRCIPCPRTSLGRKSPGAPARSG